MKGNLESALLGWLLVQGPAPSSPLPRRVKSRGYKEAGRSAAPLGQAEEVLSAAGKGRAFSGGGGGGGWGKFVAADASPAQFVAERQQLASLLSHRPLGPGNCSAPFPPAPRGPGQSCPTESGSPSSGRAAGCCASTAALRWEAGSDWCALLGEGMSFTPCPGFPPARPSSFTPRSRDPGALLGPAGVGPVKSFPRPPWLSTDWNAKVVEPGTELHPREK